MDRNITLQHNIYVIDCYFLPQQISLLYEVPYYYVIIMKSKRASIKYYSCMCFCLRCLSCKGILNSKLHPVKNSIKYYDSLCFCLNHLAWKLQIFCTTLCYMHGQSGLKYLVNSQVFRKNVFYAKCVFCFSLKIFLFLEEFGEIL